MKYNGWVEVLDVMDPKGPIDNFIVGLFKLTLCFLVCMILLIAFYFSVT